MADSAPATTPAPAATPEKNPLKRLYRWILSWAHHPWGTLALAVFAFLDSSVFPVPPLFLQVALSLEKPRRSFWYAFVDTAASVAGAVLGYTIGAAFYDSLGKWVVTTWASEAGLAETNARIREGAFTFILIYSFFPFPYKLITIGSGLLGVDLPVLLGASVIGRGWRFFLLGAMCFFWGPRVKTLIEKYFNWVCLGIGALVVAVLAVMKLWTRS